VVVPARASARFEDLIGEVLGRLVQADPRQIDDAVVTTLGRLAQALQMDAAVVWRKASAADASVALTHSWMRPSLTSSLDLVRMAGVPWVTARLDAGRAAWFSDSDELPQPDDRAACRSAGAISAAVFPVNLGADRTSSAMAFATASRPHSWLPAIVERIHVVAAIVGQALRLRDVRSAHEHALGEIRRLSEGDGPGRRLQREPRKPAVQHGYTSLQSSAIRRVLKQVEQVAALPATVLLLGETGSGKEVFAQAIHEMSPRRHRAMVKLNCAAIPSALIESELFGREAGAYTGAMTRQIGRFEAAHHSTLFLDEIGELPFELQVKLLRVLQERVIVRLGSTRTIPIDVRIIAATNRNLEQAVQDKTFRDDLYYRLNVFPIIVPPLRDRLDDIPHLVWSLIDELSPMLGKPIDTISEDSIRRLRGYSWPGNVRELRNVIERTMIVCQGRHLELAPPDLPGTPIPAH
jgi:transcriptional regulator with GAF, ATPase, and Fis domain